VQAREGGIVTDKTKELTALETLDAILAEAERQDEERQAALVKRLEEEHARRQRQHRRDHLATLEVAEVRARCRRGTLSAEDVKVWHEAREERLRRAAMQMGISLFTAETGRVARLIEGPDGPLVVVR
jgi:hypothetical protein